MLVHVYPLVLTHKGIYRSSHKPSYSWCELRESTSCDLWDPLGQGWRGNDMISGRLLQQLEANLSFPDRCNCANTVSVHRTYAIEFPQLLTQL